MNTNTPRTDAARLWHFDEPVVPMGFACELEVEAAFWQAKAHEAEEHEGKQEAEVERLTDALKSCWHAANTYDGNYTAACDNVMAIVNTTLKIANPEDK